MALSSQSNPTPSRRYKEYKLDPYEILKLREARVVTKPFPHLIVDNFFDDITYKRILELWPKNEEMVAPRAYSRQLDLKRDPLIPESAKGEWEIDNHLNGERLAFWSEIRRRMCGQDFITELKAKFVVEDLVYPHCRIMVDHEGSGLGPHTDRYDKAVSCLYYIGDNPLACPTTLLKPKNRLSHTQEHLTFDDFTVVEEIEHKPNRFFAFAVSSTSYHAFHQKVASPRKTIKYFLHRYVDVREARKEIEKTRKAKDDWRK